MRDSFEEEENLCKENLYLNFGLLFVFFSPLIEGM